MKKEHKNLEKLEFYYFQKIERFLKSKKKLILKGLDSKNKIWDYWKKEFRGRDKYKSSILDRGAERVFFDIFPIVKSWKVNSSPIGSDLMYETNNAFLHIDIKTVSVSGNFNDASGKCQVQKNQTSYPAKGKFSGPSLPTYYKKKPCLTYFIEIIHDSQNRKKDTLAIVLICVPNGKLYKYYGEKIINAGKMSLNKDGLKNDFRFSYHKEPNFLLLSSKKKKIFRRSLIHFDNSNYRNLSKKILLKE